MHFELIKPLKFFVSNVLCKISLAFQQKVFCFFSFSPSLSLSLGHDLSASDLINKGLVWGKGRVRGVYVRLYVCVCMTLMGPLA